MKTALPYFFKYLGKNERFKFKNDRHWWIKKSLSTAILASNPKKHRVVKRWTRVIAYIDESC